jgi:hypothetical protein
MLALQWSSSYEQDINIDYYTIVWMVEAPTNPYCQVTVEGSVEMYVVGYWGHQQPDTHYRRIYQTDVAIFTNTIVGVEYDGTPLAIEWYSRPYGIVTKNSFELVKTCGTVPSRIFPLIFQDGFETGNTDAWSPEVP